MKKLLFSTLVVAVFLAPPSLGKAATSPSMEEVSFSLGDGWPKNVFKKSKKVSKNSLHCSAYRQGGKLPKEWKNSKNNKVRRSLWWQKSWYQK
jgi:hypothetical protein